MMLDMDHMLMVLLVLVWSSGLHAKEIHNVPVRLVGGSSRCAGTLEVQYYGHWSGVDGFYWTAKEAAVVCRKLDCGSLVSVDRRKSTDNKATLKIASLCVYPERTVHDCIRRSYSSSVSLEITCSDSVRLVNGTSLCSGRLEVKSAQSDQRWSSVCEADFDQQDAEVVCRELGCGAPSVLQGALYGEVEAPTWTKEFQCGGNESALLDCRSSDSVQTSCPSGRAVRLTCSEQIRLVGGDSRCAGKLELKQGEWRPVTVVHWTLNYAAAVCRYLDCGSAVSTGTIDSTPIPMWLMGAPCLSSSSVKKDCVKPDTGYNIVVINCSDSVRLLDGTSLCSGRLEVKSAQSDQRWSSVCEADFDQQDAEVVCRELGCGAPSVLQGALYGEVEAPTWTKEFQCGGNESALLDCRSSGSTRNTCSPGKAVGLTCSEPVRLAGGDSRCAGTLELKQGEWRPVSGYDWTVKEAAVFCKALDCGSAVSMERRNVSSWVCTWWTYSHCVQSGSTLKDCVLPSASKSIFSLTCSAADKVGQVV